MRVIEAWKDDESGGLKAIVEDAHVVAGQSMIEFRNEWWRVAECRELDGGPRSMLSLTPCAMPVDGGSPSASGDSALVAALEACVPARVDGESHLLTKVVCAAEFVDSRGERYVVTYNTTAGGGHVPSWDQIGLLSFALDCTRESSR